MAASCWVRSAPSWRRVSAVCARALSRSTELCASVRSRRKPSKSVHDSAKLRRFKLRFPPSNPCHGSFSPWLEVLYDAVSLGKYCERLDQSVAAVARSDAAACITAGAWRSATVRSSVVSGTGGSCESGIARTTPSTPICRARFAWAVARFACACSSASRALPRSTVAVSVSERVAAPAWNLLTEIWSSSLARSSCASATRTSSSLARDRKSTRLNSSHSQISYAVFCLKKKKKQNKQRNTMHKKECGANRPAHLMQIQLRQTGRLTLAKLCDKRDALHSAWTGGRSSDDS